MASFKGATNFLSSIPKRYASAKTAQSTAERVQRKFIKPEGVQVTKLPNGIVVATLENHSPVSHVSAVVNAGARHETADSRGVAHALRAYANLSTKNFYTLGISRTFDHLGAKFDVTSTREHTFYNLEITRNNLDKAGAILAELVSAPEFRTWELSEAYHRLELDLEVYEQSPELQISDLLHRAAFRNGLARSLYADRHLAGKFNTEQLLQFREENFSADRLSLVGVGVNHESLVHLAKKFHLKDTTSKPEASKYLGDEVRVDNDNELVHVAFGCEGASLSSKELLASGILSQAFGTGPRIKWSDGASRITRACLPLASKPALVSSFNLNYSDAGLFGFHVIADRDDTGKLVKGVFKEVSKVAKNGLTNEELAAAKNKLKAALGFSHESSRNVVEAIAKSAEHANLTEVSKAIDAVSAADVNSFAKKVASGKPSLAAIGDLRNLPRLDELN